MTQGYSSYLTDSYVALCRQLNLEHEWQPGDFYFLRWVGPKPLIKAKGSDRKQDEYGPAPVDEHVAMVGPQLVPRPVKDADSAWLPRLSDWLEMLEAAGYRAVAICRKTGLGRPDECWAESHRLLPEGGFSEDFHAEGATREEAAARLWMEVMDKRDVP